MYTCAIIGAGTWGKKLILELNTNCHLKAVVYKSNPETANWLMLNSPNSLHTTDISSVINDSSISHVFIATPINTHYEISMRCLDAKKVIFVEKPLARTVKEVEDLYRRASFNGTRISSGYIYLHDPGLKQLKEKILSDEQDTKIIVNQYWEKYGSFNDSIADNLLVHEIAIANYLLGNYKNILNNEIKENHVMISIEFEKGVSNIYIDREKSVKKKVVAVTLGSDIYELENSELYKNRSLLSKSTNNLLELELNAFFNNSIENYAVDKLIAEILEKIKN